MIKKLNFPAKLISVFSLVVILASCESREQKPDDAFEHVKEEKMISKDTTSVSKEIVDEPIKKEPIKKIENIDEWTKFKMETEKKIVANEKKIKQIKEIPNSNSKLLRKVTGLEQDNNDLRKQMDEYNEEVKLKWENFKMTMNHNVNEIDIELKDLTVNNKK